MADSQPKLRIVDSPSIAPIYVNKFVMAGFDGGAMIITLGETRFVSTRIGETPKTGEHPSVYVTARLALSPNATVELVNNLTRMLETMGVAKTAAQPPKEPDQKAH